MPKLAAVDVSRVPMLPASDVRLLWVNDFYDRPLEAVVERGDERLLMVLSGDAPPATDAPSVWLLFRLSEDQWREEERWHALYEEHVGSHWCFHRPTPGDEPPTRDPSRFFSLLEERVPLDLTETAPVAWVDQLPAR